MHRTKTRFAARVNHVATALERRGVRATYTLHDRVLSNRSSRRHFTGARPELDDVQQRILSELDADGYSLLTFDELFPESDAWREIEAQSSQFVAETEAALAGDREGAACAGGQGVRRSAAQLRRGARPR